MPSRIFFGNRAAASGGSGATQLILANDYASFTFDPDSTSGYKLSTFNRIGGHAFPNSTTELWSAEVYDTTSAPTITVATITPTDATFTAPSIATDSQGQYISCVWTSVPVGGDALNVTVTLRLNDTEDFLRVRISAAWNGTATTYALHSLSVLGMSVTPYHQGFDYAVLPFGFGILSEDPVENLRYANGVPGFPVTGFGRLTTNTWRYPNGRGWAMAGPWGYYETQSSEAWMVYCEDWSLEVFDCTFQGDGSELAWSMRQEQPDHVIASNNGRSLGSGYTFCLRPFQITQAHGWVDMGKHYKQRIDSQRPSFWTPIRRDRLDYSDAERSNAPFVDFSLQSTASPLATVDVDAMLQSVITNSGIPSGTNIFGIIEAPSYNLDKVAETAKSTLQAQLTSVYNNGTAYLGIWKPEFVGPAFWDIARWHQNLGDAAENRWWTSNDLLGSLRMSRQGYLEGGGTDRLGHDVLSGIYYRERNYGISSWTGPTLIATVAGTPSTDGFTGTLHAVLIPSASATMLASALVTSMGATTIKLYTGFKDSLGFTAIPLPGDSIEVYNDINQNAAICYHSQVGSQALLDRITNNTSLGVQSSFKSCGYYFDVFTDPLMISQSDRVGFCYRNHTAWSKIDPGYVNHPLGGGDYHKNGIRNYVKAFKDAAKGQQISDGTTQFFWLTCEDIDETMHDRFDWCWHTVSSGYLWRNTVGTDPSIHKYKTIPLYCVVYAGKTMGRGLNNEFSSAALEPSAPYSDPDLHAFLAFCLAVEWPYGITWPTLSFYTTDAIPLRDFWDNTQYASAGGPVSDTVRLIRDLWSQIAVAETTWLLDSGFRYGEFMAPGAVNYSATDTTTSYAQSIWTLQSPFYHGYDTIYERTAFPRVIHQPWGADDGSVVIVLVNWTDTTARWQASWNLTDLGFSSTSRVRFRVVDHQNRTVEPSSTHEGAVITLGINEVPAFTTRFIVLDEEPTLTFRSRAVMIRARW